MALQGGPPVLQQPGAGVTAPGCPPGLLHLATLDQFCIKQKKEWGEIMTGGKNSIVRLQMVSLLSVNILIRLGVLQQIQDLQLTRSGGFLRQGGYRLLHAAVLRPRQGVPDAHHGHPGQTCLTIFRMESAVCYLKNLSRRQLF